MILSGYTEAMKNSVGKKAVAALCLFLAVGAVAALFWSRRPPAEPTPAVIEGSKAESELLAASHGLARRDGLRLELVQKSGEILALTDHRQCGDLPCPKDLALSYRYLGWDEAIGGYQLQVDMGANQRMVLTYGDDEPELVDARHGAAAREPVPMPVVIPPPVKTDDSLGEWLADLTADREQNEKPLIAAHSERVSRDGRTLTIRLQDQRNFVLQDDLICGQLACPPQISRSFDYVGTSPDGQFQVVHEEGNETEEGLLINRDGELVVTLSVPSFSPDGKAAVAMISDLEASAPRRLELWDLNDGKASLVFSLPAREEDDTIYEMVAWVDNTHLRLRRGPWGSDQRNAVMLVGDASGWHIQEGGN